MIQRVWIKCCESLSAEEVFVATDDNRIEEVCRAFGANVLHTSSDCLTGTDRVAEAAESLSADCLINVQGDEPLIDPRSIDQVIEAFSQNNADVCNAMCEIENAEEFTSPNVPKVVFDENLSLMYMSRAPIPANKSFRFEFGYKQVCIYAFSKPALAAYASRNEKSQFESVEDIEILRFLEMGYSVQMVKVQGGTVAVDVPEDISTVESILAG